MWNDIETTKVVYGDGAVAVEPRRSYPRQPYLLVSIDFLTLFPRASTLSAFPSAFPYTYVSKNEPERYMIMVSICRWRANMEEWQHLYIER